MRMEVSIWSMLTRRCQRRPRDLLAEKSAALVLRVELVDCPRRPFRDALLRGFDVRGRGASCTVALGVTSAARGPDSASSWGAPGTVRCGVTEIPALRVMAATSDAWSLVWSVTTTPEAPARAVRPERWR